MSNDDIQNELLNFASYNLKLRYSQLEQDIAYLQEVDRFYFQKRYNKYFKKFRNELNVFENKFKTFEDKFKAKAGEDLRSTDKVHRQNDLANSSNLRVLYRQLSEELGGKKGTEDKINFQPQWHSFRLAIEQRMVPKYSNFLNKIDIIIRDCFYAVKGLEKITCNLLELPPLAVLEVGRTFLVRPTDESVIPFIVIPIDRMDTPWNLCAIHHEVGHDLFHRLTKKDPGRAYFRNNITNRMNDVLAISKDIARINKSNDSQYYLNWLEELVADMFGVMLAGPTYINSGQEILLKDDVFTDFAPDYPSSHIRIIFNIIFTGDKLGYKTIAAHLRDRWEMLFPRQDQIQWLNNNLNPGETNKLTPEAIDQWLRCLVEACWEANIVDDVSLRKIFEQMNLVEYEDLYSKKSKKLEQLNEKQQARLRRITKQKIKQAKDKLVGLEQADYHPRRLVPALRLAYEEIVMQNKHKQKRWEKQLSARFLDSVTEPTNVANFFASHHH